MNLQKRNQRISIVLITGLAIGIASACKDSNEPSKDLPLIPMNM